MPEVAPARNEVPVQYAAVPAAPELQGALLADKRVQQFLEQKEQFLNRVHSVAADALAFIESAVHALDAIRSAPEGGVLRGVVQCVKICEFVAAAMRVAKFSPRGINARVADLLCGGRISSEISEDQIEIGEELHELGRQILGHQFISLNPRVILGREYPKVQDALIGHGVDPEEFERVKRQHEQEISRLVDRARDGVLQGMAFKIEHAGPLSLRVRFSQRRRRGTAPSPLPGSRSEEAEKRSGKDDHPVARKGVQRLFGGMSESMADMTKGFALGKLALCLDQLCVKCAELEGREALTLAPGTWSTLRRIRDDVEKGLKGNAAQFEAVWLNLLQSLDQVEALLIDVAGAVEEGAYAAVFPKSAIKIKALAEARVAELLAAEKPASEFRTRDGHRVPRALTTAIFAYSFALEQGDAAAAAAHYAAADAFQRREVRTALQVLYHDYGLIHDRAYEELRQNCGQHREAPPPPPAESEEERSARVRAAQELQERRELAAIGLADFVADQVECERLAQFVTPATIDSAVRRLETIFGKGLSTKLLSANPQLFAIAEEHPETFATYAYTLLQNVERILQRCGAGADPARYADPQTLSEVLKEDSERERRAVQRDVYERGLKARGFHPGAVMAILAIGFADAQRGHNTTESAHVPAATVFARLQAAIENYCEVEGLLRAEFEKLNSLGVLHGKGTYALNLLGGKKAPEEKGFWRDVVRLAMSAPPAGEMITVEENRAQA